MGDILLISNEDEAWRLLERLQAGLPVDLSNGFQLSGWPKMTIYVKSGDASISSEMMESLLAYQDMIYRSASLIIREKDDLRSQTLAEREKFEIRVRVTEGSTKGEVDLTAILQEVARESIGKMSSTEILIAILAAGLYWTSSTMYKTYMNNKLEEKKLESKDKERAAIRDQQIEMSKQETERAKLLSATAQKSAIIAQIDDLSEDAAIELFDIAATEGDTTVAGVEATTRRAEIMGKRKRRSSTSENIQAEFLVTKADGTPEDGFKAQLQFKDDEGRVFTATLANLLIASDDAENAIRNAFWEKKSIELVINAKMFDDKISEAEVVAIV